jgi:hypothetical protein
LRVSGFTIARNVIKFGYPVEASLRSLLPLVDELVVAVGDSEDATWDLVTGIGDPKIKPFRTVWDMSKHEGGLVLSEQTNLALAQCSGDWAVYLQTDEVLHEEEIDLIRGRLRAHLNQATEGLSFSYLHFYGSYSTVQDNWCRWYWREVRAVKTGKGIVSVGDAAGFKVQSGTRLRRLIRADSGAHVYHYGWARPPAVMVEKRQHVATFYQAEGPESAPVHADRLEPAEPYRDLGHLRTFSGSHPATMVPMVTAQDWRFDSGTATQRPRWARYLGLVRSCPRDSLRILISRLILVWNTYVAVPKLR